MKRSKLTETQKSQIIDLHEQGVKSREIARVVLGRASRKSTVNDFLKKVNDGLKEVVESERGKTFDLSSIEFTARCNRDNVFTIKTSKTSEEGCVHLVIPDTQVKEGVNTVHLEQVGKLILDVRPDVIIHLGDHADMPSLSSYDRGKKSAEGKRVSKDIDAAIEGMKRLLKPLYEYQKSNDDYHPRMVMCLGNHEERILRHVEANPELEGFLSVDSLKYKEFGWEVYDFLVPVNVNGVNYCHYMANPMSGKPYGGTAQNVLNKVGESFTVGHKQVLEIATRALPTSGKQQWGITCGACYSHTENYKGPQGNHHWRGVILKSDVREGDYSPMFISLDTLKEMV